MRDLQLCSMQLQMVNRTTCSRAFLSTQVVLEMEALHRTSLITVVAKI